MVLEDAKSFRMALYCSALWRGLTTWLPYMRKCWEVRKERKCCMNPFCLIRAFISLMRVESSWPSPLLTSLYWGLSFNVHFEGEINIQCTADGNFKANEPLQYAQDHSTSMWWHWDSNPGKYGLPPDQFVSKAKSVVCSYHIREKKPKTLCSCFFTVP